MVYIAILITSALASWAVVFYSPLSACRLFFCGIALSGLIPGIIFMISRSPEWEIRGFGNIIIVLIFVALAVYTAGTHPANSLTYPNKIVLWVMFTALAVSLVFWLQSLRWIGNMFCDGVAMPDKIITNGPYVLSRHPIYLSWVMILILVGGILTMFTAQFYRLYVVDALLMLGVVLTYYGSKRIKAEEAILLKIDAYQKYKDKTPMLIPTVYCMSNFLSEQFVERRAYENSL